ncbi:hypothetical protein NXX60_19035 [Bacteroides thetaiotaomicron]|nr:hypothetical protein NXX60_19035 [Bacteroides thetaiotaomicron]
MRRYVGGNSDGYYYNSGWNGCGDYYGFPGSGDSSYYSQYDFDNWEGPWYGGWVYGMGYVYPDVNIYGTYGGPKYTLDDLFYWEGTWNGGYVVGVGYVGPDNNVTTYDPNKLPQTGVEIYDMMYCSGFDLGYEAGQSGSTWANVGAKACCIFGCSISWKRLWRCRLRDDIFFSRHQDMQKVRLQWGIEYFYNIILMTLI